jgi:L-alanine-DL-glutamate epimerase-like enolase superfamily enzyme
VPRGAEIVRVEAATVRAHLPAPVVFGDWVMAHREYVVVRVLLASGVEGWAFTLTRDGAVAPQVRGAVAAVYVGTDVGERERTFALAGGRSRASHSSGIGLRALSVVDLACWDAAARAADVSVTRLLGGEPTSMPATAIIGYPPATMPAEAVEAQTRELYRQGWRRFKAPVAADEAVSVSRLCAARRAAPDAWLGCDGAWMFSAVDDVVRFADAVRDARLDSLEDVIPPGDAVMLQEIRERVGISIAMGDEQGGAYYPQALIRENAVDLVRIDLTCMGGISGARRIVDECVAAGVDFSPHMFAHVHSRVFPAWGHPDVPIEWGVPWTGVDPYADSLPAPEIRDGRMTPLPDDPGFGELVNREWLSTQSVDDPDDILGF